MTVQCNVNIKLEELRDKQEIIKRALSTYEVREEVPMDIQNILISDLKFSIFVEF